MTESTLTALIDTALARSREPDPHVVARRLLTRLPDELRAELLIAGLVDRVRNRIHLDRMHNGLTQRRPGPSKWSVIRVPVLGKFLEDCDLSDLEALAQDYRERGAALIARATEVDGLADDLRASGCATVGEMWSQADKDLAA